MLWYLKFNGFFHPLHSKNFFTYRNYHSQGLRQCAGIARGYWKIPERLANSQPLMSGGKADRGGGISQPKRNFPIPPSNACAIDIVTLRRINEVQWCALENQQSTFYVVKEVTLTGQNPSLKFC